MQSDKDFQIPISWSERTTDDIRPVILPMLYFVLFLTQDRFLKKQKQKNLEIRLDEGHL
jgi:hypothetical protein